MDNKPKGIRRRNRATVGVLALIGVATLLLSACSSGAAGGNGGSSTDEDKMSISVTPAASADLNPTKPITVKAAKGKLTSVTVTNPEGEVVSGAFGKGKTTWHTTVPLGYDKQYTVHAQGKSDEGKKADKKSTVHTLKPKAQVYPSLIPPPGSSDSVGVGLPLVVRFDQPIQNKAAAERSLKVTSTPAQEGAWHWVDDKTVDYRPKQFWQPGTKIHLHVGIYGKDLGGGVYGQTDRDLDVTVHDSWIAKANGSTEQMQILHNGKLVKTMPISMGKDATPTHEGVHVVSSKSESYTMDSCSYGVCKGQPGYYRTVEHYAERISNDGEFVHENPDSVGDQGSSNVSHGCINLDQANASWFFDHFGVGDVVEVSNSGGPHLPIYDLYGDWSLSWPEWLKGSALQH